MATSNNTKTSPPVSDVMKEFLGQYKPALYEELANFAVNRCRAILKGAGILAIVTGRGKSLDRVRAKIVQRNVDESRGGQGIKSGPYQTVAEIKKDLVDLAGIRVALYFPGDAERVVALLQDPTAALKWPIAPFMPSTATTKAIAKIDKDGYRATHLRLEVNTILVGSVNKEFGGCGFEIQVATLLMHAWSEVNHDMVYKTLTGPLDASEKEDLDALNKNITAGEQSLKSLEKHTIARSKAQLAKKDPSAPFSSTFELGAYVKQFGTEGAVVGPLDWLSHVTDYLQLNTPKTLEPVLNKWALGGAMAGPLVPSILNHIVSSRSFESLHKVTQSGNLCPFLEPASNAALYPGGSHSPIEVVRLILRDVVHNRYLLDEKSVGLMKEPLYYQALENKNYFAFNLDNADAGSQADNLCLLWDRIEGLTRAEPVSLGKVSSRAAPVGATDQIKLPVGKVSLAIARAKIAIELGYY